MIEAMKQALEALEDVPYMSNKDDYERFEKAQAALRQAIEQAEKQESVAWVCEGSSSDEKHSIDYWQDEIDAIPVGTMLYTTPLNPMDSIKSSKTLDAQPQREWVGLTDDELKPICDENHIMLGAYAVDFIRAIEAKLKEKNT